MAATAEKSTIADTFSRLLRLTLPASPGLTGTQLMDISEVHLSTVARANPSTEQLIASRVLDNPRDFRRWESEHARLMDGVAREPRQGLKVRSLLSLSFSLMHRKALFEYLRSHAARGHKRRLLVAHFHGGYSYTQSMVAEHGNYLRSAASLLCATHIGATTFVHQAFGDPLRGYGQVHMEYFRSYCDSLIAPAGGPHANAIQVLLPQLKREVLELRTRLLAMPAQPPKPLHVKPTPPKPVPTKPTHSGG